MKRLLTKKIEEDRERLKEQGIVEKALYSGRRQEPPKTPIGKNADRKFVIKRNKKKKRKLEEILLDVKAR